MSHEIYTKLADMVAQATQKVKVLVPSTDYYASRGDFSEDTMYIIDGAHLESLLRSAAVDALPEDETYE